MKRESTGHRKDEYSCLRRPGRESEEAAYIPVLPGKAQRPAVVQTVQQMPFKGMETSIGP